MDKYPQTVTQTKKIQKNLKDFVKFGESDTIFFKNSFTIPIEQTEPDLKQIKIRKYYL